MDKNIDQIPDAAIDKALDTPMSLDHTLRQLIRGDTEAVGYSKTDVVRKLLDALNVYVFPPSSRLQSTPLQAFKDWESAAATPGAAVIHDEVMLPDSFHKVADEMRNCIVGGYAWPTLVAWADRIEALATPKPVPMPTKPVHFIRVKDAVRGTALVSKVFPGDVIAEDYDVNVAFQSRLQGPDDVVVAFKRCTDDGSLVSKEGHRLAYGGVPGCWRVKPEDFPAAPDDGDKFAAATADAEQAAMEGDTAPEAAPAGEVVRQFRHNLSSQWQDTTEQQLPIARDAGYEVRTLYTRPQPAPAAQQPVAVDGASIEQRAREFLAAEYESGHLFDTASRIRSHEPLPAGWKDVCIAIRAIAAALRSGSQP